MKICLLQSKFQIVNLKANVESLSSFFRQNLGDLYLAPPFALSGPLLGSYAFFADFRAAQEQALAKLGAALGPKQALLLPKLSCEDELEFYLLDSIQIKKINLTRVSKTSQTCLSANGLAKPTCFWLGKLTLHNLQLGLIYVQGQELTYDLTTTSGFAQLCALASNVDLLCLWLEEPWAVDASFDLASSISFAKSCQAKLCVLRGLGVADGLIFGGNSSYFFEGKCEAQIPPFTEGSLELVLEDQALASLAVKPLASDNYPGLDLRTSPKA
ncbi:MAG: hypothetical protein IJS50_01295, partial [Desulfovibrio sp.]|nr:hypothetical protein [Desulfovibrio sp.]